MTGKQLLKTLFQEKYDRKGLEVIFHHPNGEKHKIGAVEKVGQYIVLTSDGLIQGDGETASTEE